MVTTDEELPSPRGRGQGAEPREVTDGDTTAVVRAILSEFARRTGVVGDAPTPRRYLWTDAFAVCTLLALAETAEVADVEGGQEALATALRLVDQVHETLGRHRADDRRTGWISGLDADEGRAHPTCGGLRIGKRLPERHAAEPFDERSEWDRDGQYFHYLTRWMHALARVAEAQADEPYLRWAIELARAAHEGFTYSVPGSMRKRMVWKMSIDLTRPLVPSMGAHDPLDGLLTFRALRRDALRSGWSAADVALDDAIEDMRSMCAGLDLATADPLGIGGLLCDAYRLAQLSEAEPDDEALLPRLVDGAAAGIAALARTDTFERPARERLAFRELGLAIGLHAVPRLARLVERDGPPTRHMRGLRRRLETLRPFLPVAGTIEAFWLDPGNREAESWRAHLDINSVMLATSLLPAGLLAP